MHATDMEELITKKLKSDNSTLRRNILIFYGIYIILNAIVVYKYGSRQNYIDPCLLAIVYSLFLLIILFLNIKYKLKENIYKYLFFTGSLVFLLSSIWLNTHVDKYALQVDRWSAMDACIKALIHNQYPYSAIDHLQGKSSNLPALIFLGVPFYFLGDVGYLQSFTFIVFLIVICKYFKSYRVRFWALLTITLSSTYCYDIYVKSDIISNFILTLTFVVVSEKYYNNTSQKKDIIFNSIGSALLIMTRIVTVIPLILLLFKKFLKMNFKNKGLFVCIFLLLVVLLFSAVLKNVGSWENFMANNPFYLQNSQLPFILSVLCISLAFIYSFFINNLEALIKSCTLILLITVLLSLLAKTVEFNGFYNSILNSRFDISYFNFVSPFLIFYLAILFHKYTALN